MSMMREFCGWLSADIPELHAVEVPRLAKSLDRFFALRHLCPDCGRRMTYTATAPIADTPMEWRCFNHASIGDVGQAVIEIDAETLRNASQDDEA